MYNPIMKAIVVSPLLCIVGFILILQSCSEKNIAGGAETTNTVASINVYYPNGEPLKSGSVRLRPVNYTQSPNASSIAGENVFNFLTDSLGNLIIHEIPNGEYLVEFNDDVAYAGLMRLEVVDNTKEIEIEDQFLDRYAEVNGNIGQLPELLNPDEKRYVQIYGLDRITEVDKDGNFSFDDLAVGTYDFVLISSVDSTLHVSIPEVKVNSKEISEIIVSTSGWQYQKTIRINTTISGANILDTLYAFPILLKLDQSNFDFSTALGQGEDLRVLKLDGSSLPFDIESWDLLKQSASIWVQVDTVFNQDTTRFNIRWGDHSEVSLANSESVFNGKNGFVGVWHLNDLLNLTNAVDTTKVAKDFGNTLSKGIAGEAFYFDDDSHVLIPPETFSDISDQITISVWQFGIGLADLKEVTLFDGRVSAESEEHFLLAHLPWYQPVNDIYRVYWDAGENAIESNRVKSDVLPETFQESWNHWVFSKNSLNGEMKIFLNGKLLVKGSGRSSIMSGTNIFKLGGEIGELEETSKFYRGYLDEFRVSNLERSDSWVKLNYENQKIGSKVVSFK